MKQIRITVQDLRDIQQYFRTQDRFSTHSLCSSSILEFEKHFGTSFDFNTGSLSDMQDSLEGTPQRARHDWLADNACWIICELFGKFPPRHTENCSYCAFMKTFQSNSSRGDSLSSEKFLAILRVFHEQPAMPKILASARSWANRQRVLARKKTEKAEATRGIGSFGEIIDSKGKL